MSMIHHLPRECLHSVALDWMAKRLAEANAENERLQTFAMELAERIFRAHEVLARLAERKDKRSS